MMFYLFMFPLKLDQVEESKTWAARGEKTLLCNLVKSKNYGNKNEYKGQEAIH